MAGLGGTRALALGRAAVPRRREPVVGRGVRAGLFLSISLVVGMGSGCGGNKDEDEFSDLNTNKDSKDKTTKDANKDDDKTSEGEEDKTKSTDKKDKNESTTGETTTSSMEGSGETTTKSMESSGGDSGSTSSKPHPDEGDTTPDGANNYLVGAGIYDVTGQVADTAFFGYAKGSLRSVGLRDRQYARAFIIKDPAPQGKSLVFVTIDKGGMFQSTNIRVVQELYSKYKGEYTDKNVVVTATHTHCAAGGFSHFPLYMIASGGFFEANQNALVKGIVGAVERAHNNLAPGRIYFNRGKLKNASINRSMPGYTKNKDADKFPSIDEDMTVLRFVQGMDKDIGMLSWFAVHPTNLPKDWKYASADNKGYASMAFEALHKATYDEKSYVAAFANSNPGDISPNLNQPAADDHTSDASGPGKTPEESMSIIGQRQFDAAKMIYEQKGMQLKGSIQFASRYTDMSKVDVDKKFTDGKRNYRTCDAALGASFAAGAEDGRSDVSALFKEGTTKDPNFGSEFDKCHAEKSVFLIPGLNTKKPDTPKILPTTIFKVGQLGILAAPSEFTVMSGRRVRQTVESVPGTGIKMTVFTGYSDAYSGYVTTREEYATQQYEGGSTHFGPWTLGAYRQQFHKLAQLIADPKANPWKEAEPPVPQRDKPNDASSKAGADPKPSGGEFGQVQSDAKESYKKGEMVSVSFWGGHPHHDLKTNQSYLRVQRKDRDKWVDVAFDRDQNTKFEWKKDAFAPSLLTIKWDIPKDATPGQYRIVHDGAAKEGGLMPKMVTYQGVSRVFRVE